MKVPSRVRIGKAWWTIEVLPTRLSFEAADGSRRRARGLCHYNERRIELDGTYSDKTIRSSLVHELMHAMSYEYQFEFTEANCHDVEGPVSRTLARNPALLAVFANVGLCPSCAYAFQAPQRGLKLRPAS
jgi:hypothetical protein